MEKKTPPFVTKKRRGRELQFGIPKEISFFFTTLLSWTLFESPEGYKIMAIKMGRTRKEYRISSMKNKCILLQTRAEALAGYEV